MTTRRSKPQWAGSLAALCLALTLIGWLALARPALPDDGTSRLTVATRLLFGLWQPLLLVALAIPVALCSGGRPGWPARARRYVLRLLCLGSVLAVAAMLGTIGQSDGPPEPARLAAQLSFMFGLGVCATAVHAALGLLEAGRPDEAGLPEPPGLGQLLVPLCLALLTCLLMVVPLN